MLCFIACFNEKDTSFHINQEVLNKIQKYQSSSVDTLLIYCDVFEGNNCTLLPSTLNISFELGYQGIPNNDISWLPNNISKTIIDNIGFKFVEHSSHNCVFIRCLLKEEKNKNCEIFRGSKWESLLISK